MQIWQYFYINYKITLLNLICHELLIVKFISTQLESLIPSELIMPRTNFGKFAVLQEAIQLYNSPPENIKSIDKLCNFKKCIKLYFLCLQNS